MKRLIALGFAALIAVTSLTAGPAFARRGADDPVGHNKHDRHDDHGHHGKNHR